MNRVLVLCAFFAAILLAPVRPAWADSYWLRGGLIGAGVGLGSGVAIGYVACGVAEENESSCRGVAMPLGAVVLGAAGFGLGALIGSAFEKEAPTVSPTVWADPIGGSFGMGATASF